MQTDGQAVGRETGGHRTIGPAKAVQGEIILGSPVQLNPAGAVAGVAGHRKTSAFSVAKQGRAQSIDFAALVKYRPGAMARPS